MQCGCVLLLLLVIVYVSNIHSFMHAFVEKILKAKWKGLRDNFRIQWKMIPRDESDDLLISPEDFTGTKWQYYRALLFLADNMGKSRHSYNHHAMMDDNSYELLHQFEPAIEIPSDDDMCEDVKPEIVPKQLHQRLTAVQQERYKRDPSPSHHSSDKQHQLKSSSNNSSSHKATPKLRAIPQLSLLDVRSLLAQSTHGQTTISPASVNAAAAIVAANSQQQQQQNTSNTSSASSSTASAKRKRTDEVTTTGCGASSNDDEYPSASSPNGNLPNSSQDDDYHFLMSLQPYLTQFTGPQKLRIRMKLQKLIFRELYNDDIDE